MIEKDTLLQACGGRWSDYEISKTTLGLHIVFFYSWALPLYGVLWLLSRPFHYLGELAEVVFQTWKMNQDPPRRDYVHDFDELWGSAKGCWDGEYASPGDDPLDETAKEYDGDRRRTFLFNGHGRPATVHYTDNHGVDHPVKSYEFSYYYDVGERVLFNGDLYDVYALCEPTYILREPTGNVMSSVKVTESDMEKIDVKR